MGIDGTSVEKYHLRTADAYRYAPAPAHSSPGNLVDVAKGQRVKILKVFVCKDTGFILI